jgi:hypothetical protein
MRQFPHSPQKFLYALRIRKRPYSAGIKYIIQNMHHSVREQQILLYDLCGVNIETIRGEAEGYMGRNGVGAWFESRGLVGMLPLMLWYFSSSVGESRERLSP